MYTKPLLCPERAAHLAERVTGIEQRDLTNNFDLYSRNDVNTLLVDALRDDAFALIRQRGLPALAAVYNCSVRQLSISRLFTLTYEHGKQTQVALHRDPTKFTVNVLLTPPAGFEGGGTYIKARVLSGVARPKPARWTSRSSCCPSNLRQPPVGWTRHFRSTDPRPPCYIQAWNRSIAVRQVSRLARVLACNVFTTKPIAHK